jgi:tight adherence protein B
MQLFVVGAVIFFVTITIIELILYVIRNTSLRNRKNIRTRLKQYTYDNAGELDADIIKKRIYSDIPFLNKVLPKIPGIKKIDALIIQANAKHSIGFYILFSFVLAASAHLIGGLFLKGAYQSILIGLVFGCIPFVHLKRLKRKRIENFRKQLPDGLDFLARSLKAGHAFSGGMTMAAEEFDDPLGTEFAKTLDEINFGVSVESALINLSDRIDCQELRYFVVAVILQRETGGNLAELIQTLGQLIRDKFKFDGKVRTLAAEGKFSAYVLVALPIIVFCYLWITNPNFLQPLLVEPVGKFMIFASIVMMIIGAFVMKNMVNIKV